MLSSEEREDCPTSHSSGIAEPKGPGHQPLKAYQEGKGAAAGGCSQLLSEEIVRSASTGLKDIHVYVGCSGADMGLTMIQIQAAASFA